MSTPTPNLVLNTPSSQEWADAYTYCSMDYSFTDNPGNYNKAVTDYVVLVGGHDDDELDAIYKDVKMYAARGAIIGPVKTIVDGFKNTVAQKLTMIASAKCFAGMPTQTFTDGIKALLTLLQIMAFKVERDNTGNYSGTVKISLSIVERKDPADAVWFALAHEFGHSVNLVLKPYNPNDPSYPEMYKAILPTLPDSTTANHKLEYFADSFAAIFLAAALGIDRSKIPDATDFLFKAEAEGKDHPSGDLRTAKIRETLEKRC